ncbi:N-acetylmuramoyl-L-alanine amidase [uncultured Clostridium sp.]|uniref:N-acetylmuramoyl-L-alanine amidase n=1 Tax=uncultured Clostridium sp. TaxID=59620 RepID=UPI0025F963C4|nr:N-acetylmuramoyl-L-alanine amidase [uncultured Clostridium sp.]
MELKKIISLICIFFIIFSLPIKVFAEDEKIQHIILIDAGHGGIDGGAKSKNGTIEKDINLSIANKLKNKLKDSGYIVYMTRDEDIQLDKKKVEDLTKRCNMKKETKCEAFISIHQNMFPKASCFGAQVWYASNDKSRELAEGIQETIKEKINDNNKRVAKAAKEQYKILRDGYDGACVIVECGFLSNKEEEEKLKTDEHQDNIAEGIKCGLDRYFEDK